jgi:hypothetical protein
VTCAGRSSGITDCPVTTLRSRIVTARPTLAACCPSMPSTRKRRGVRRGPGPSRPQRLRRRLGALRWADDRTPSSPRSTTTTTSTSSKQHCISASSKAHRCRGRDHGPRVRPLVAAPLRGGRRHAASRTRGRLLPSQHRPRRGRMTPPDESPETPGRFSGERAVRPEMLYPSAAAGSRGLPT